jgi:hypothetical protein
MRPSFDCPPHPHLCNMRLTASWSLHILLVLAFLSLSATGVPEPELIFYRHQRGPLYGANQKGLKRPETPQPPLSEDVKARIKEILKGMQTRNPTTQSDSDEIPDWRKLSFPTRDYLLRLRDGVYSNELGIIANALTTLEPLRERRQELLRSVADGTMSQADADPELLEIHTKADKISREMNLQVRIGAKEKTGLGSDDGLRLLVGFHDMIAEEMGLEIPYV